MAKYMVRALFPGRAGRRRFVTVAVVDHDLAGWDEIRELAERALRRVHTEWGWSGDTLLTFERQLSKSGLFAFKGPGYRMERLAWKRNVEAWILCSYNPKSGATAFRSASFGPDLQEAEREFKLVERHVLAKTPPLIPKRLEEPILDPKRLAGELTGLRYPDYSPRTRPTYMWDLAQTEDRPPGQYDKPPSAQYRRPT
jgi:hypothetical protein